MEIHYEKFFKFFLCLIYPDQGYGVVVGVGHVDADGVARREVEDDDVAPVDAVGPGEAVVVPHWPLDVGGRRGCEGHRVLRHGEADGGVWHSRAVAVLADAQMVASTAVCLLA